MLASNSGRTMLRCISNNGQISKTASNYFLHSSLAISHGTVRFNSTTHQPSTNSNNFNNNTTQFNSTAAAPVAPSTPVSSLGKEAKVSAYSPESNQGGKGIPGGKKKTGFFTKLKRFTYTSLILGTGTFAYFVYEANHPPAQLPFEAGKKHVVILGSGWGSTSFLKNIDTEKFNVTVISPFNYFLFTPLLPSVPVGTLNARSIAQPTRHVTRNKKREVQVLEAEATHVDFANKTVTFENKMAGQLANSLGSQTIPYDYLVYAVGNTPQTFGIEGINKHALMLKELGDAEKIRDKLMDCIETASLAGQSKEEVDRLLTCAVVGGGASGVEFASELRDFIAEDISKWYPEIANKFQVLLIEAMPKVLPAFSQKLVEYTMNTFKDNNIEVLTQHQVKDCSDKAVTVKTPSGESKDIPYGLLVWVAGNTARPITKEIMATLSEHQTDRRGLKVDDHMRLLGASEVYSIGDATSTAYAPTAQAASQQGAYLGKIFNQLGLVEELQAKLEMAKSKADLAEVERLEKKIQKASRLRPFKYSHNGSLAYIGSHNAIADLPFGNGTLAIGGIATYYLWRSAYASMLFGLRCRSAVLVDWVKVYLFGRDVSRE